tara:strand:+ start:273 stop:560 length:288 start_codon:yes stop_codon:yes gene_type:complete
MKKKKKKARSIKHINKDVANMYKDMNREDKGTVYMFHNTVLNIMLFVNCKDAEEASLIFDSCGFARRSDWKIFLEMGQQPTDGPVDDNDKECRYH